MTHLFSGPSDQHGQGHVPLSEKLRPQTLGDIVGQTSLVGPHGIVKTLLEKNRLPSLILWGPPGSGKTTLALAIARHSQAKFCSLSAVLCGVKDLREIVESAKADLMFAQRRSLVFIDEIHRFNKAQQDALLPHLEAGTLTLIGATTENPSFEVINPLLSRCRVLVLEALQPSHLKELLDRGLAYLKRSLSAEAERFLLEYAQGDARTLLNTLETASYLGAHETLSLPDLERAAQKKSLNYDKQGEEHYNVISAFIKSMRASNPDAAVYYLARMYEAGEEPRFLARRMIIFASEDIGLADPQALQIATAAAQAYDWVGQAEGWIPLAHAAIYLALAPKSNASYRAYKQAKAEVEKSGALPVPLALRNAPTALMKALDYGKNYRYAHSDPEGSKHMQCLPDPIKNKKFFDPPE